MKFDTPITYPHQGELMADIAQVRHDIAKAATYRRRALCLLERLREEREYRKCAEHLAEVTVETMGQRAGKIEQENIALRLAARGTRTMKVQDDERLFCTWCNKRLAGLVELLPGVSNNLEPFCAVCASVAMAARA